MEKDKREILELVDYVILWGQWKTANKKSKPKSLPARLKVYETDCPPLYQGFIAVHHRNEKIEHLFAPEAREQRAVFRKKLEGRFQRQIAEEVNKRHAASTKAQQEAKALKERARQEEINANQQRKRAAAKQSKPRNAKPKAGPVKPPPQSATAQTDPLLPAPAKVASQPAVLDCIKDGENWPNNKDRFWYSICGPDGSDLGAVRPAYCDVKVHAFFKPSETEQLVHKVLLDIDLPNRPDTALVTHSQIADLRKRLTKGETPSHADLAKALRSHPDLVKKEVEPKRVGRIIREVALLLSYADPQFKQATSAIRNCVRQAGGQNWPNNTARIWYYVYNQDGRKLGAVYPGYCDELARMHFRPSAIEQLVHKVLLEADLPDFPDEALLDSSKIQNLKDQLTGCNEPTSAAPAQRILRAALSKHANLQINEAKNTGQIIREMAELLTYVDPQFEKTARGVDPTAEERYKNTLRNYGKRMKQDKVSEETKASKEGQSIAEITTGFIFGTTSLKIGKYRSFDHLIEDMDPDGKDPRILRFLMESRKALMPHAIVGPATFTWNDPRAPPQV